MKKYIRLLCACVLIGAPLPSHSAAGDKIVYMYGLGTDSCGKLVQAFRDESPNRALNDNGRLYSSISHTYQEWLAGYITAYNSYTSSTGNVSGGTDMNGLMEWVHSYCQKNPTDLVVWAAGNLIKFMSQKQ